MGLRSKNRIGEQVRLDIETGEDLFNRIADVAYGTPAARLEIPETRDFAAVTLFLRELMHQAGFNSIMVIK